jgi:N-carbamoylputrescine amidase
LSDKILRAGLVQHACGEDRAANLERSAMGIRDAVAAGAKVVLLQELHASRYFCQTEDMTAFDLAETVPGPTTETLSRLARELAVVIVGSVFEKRAAGLFHNTAVVIDADGTLAGKYRKTHIPDDPGYSEKYYFTPGDLGLHPVDTSVGRLGVLVCWDQWYPEAARLMALAGAEILLYPTAIGYDSADGDDEQQRQLDAWTTVQRGHAVANHLPVLACNRVGVEKASDGKGSIRFWGNSFACGPQGEMLKRAGGQNDEVLICDLDLSRGPALRRIWPFLRDRRIDLYSDLTRRFRDD